MITSTSKVLVTGANGFVGQVLCRYLIGLGCSVRAAVRTSDVGAAIKETSAEIIVVGDIGCNTDWSAALRDINVVIHLAARVHVMAESSQKSLQDYRAVNVLGSEALARQAAAADVRRLVFLSSIKVNGEATFDWPYSEHVPPAPQDAYGISKWEAERALLQVMAETGLEVVVLRVPLVYGPGVKANFMRLLNLVESRRPLPLAAIHNRRSLIYVGNLVHALWLAAHHPVASGKIFCVSDLQDFSTPELIRTLAHFAGFKPVLFAVPLIVLRIFAILVGRSAEFKRLASSLQVDASGICRDLGWEPPFSAEAGLAATIQHHMRCRR